MTTQRSLKGSRAPEEEPAGEQNTPCGTTPKLDAAFKEILDAAPIAQLRAALNKLLADESK